MGEEILLPNFKFFPVGNIDMLAKKIQELFKYGISKEEKVKKCYLEGKL